ncbi:MAG: arylesterase [Thiocapsa sp.]|uniref:arylesterase n=1 Tax=Thiocapsa sp. TaxID=2024551 RepID=UPI001BCBEFFC|nr:arylesterase [Thiocapsa sp.]QVL48060.1 MAG: arylesterase [Thiocapsa sp.]
MIRLLLLTCMLLPALTLAKSATDAPVIPPVILVLGDSLSASYGLDRESGWVSLLEERLRERGLAYRVVNASVSGDTTAGGLTRLGALLDDHAPAIVLIELGANDGLRGLGFEVIRNNLTTLVARSSAAGSQVVMTGLRLPPNYGAAYTDGFQAVFREVAEVESVPLVPDLLAGVAENRDLMQADGLHPTAEAQPRILDNVWPILGPLLEASR